MVAQHGLRKQWTTVVLDEWAKWASERAKQIVEASVSRNLEEVVQRTQASETETRSRIELEKTLGRRSSQGQQNSEAKDSLKLELQQKFAAADRQ